MSALIYIYIHQLKNRMRSNLKKPTAWVALAFIGLYIVGILAGFGQFAKTLNIGSAEQYITIILIMQFYFGTLSIISYFRRKGLIFTKSDIHFVFPAPVSPKLVLMFAAFKGILISLLLMLTITVIGVLQFPEAKLKFLIFGLVYLSIDIVLENSLVILCYGNEVITAEQIRVVKLVAYALLAAVTFGFVFKVLSQGYSPELLVDYLSLPAIKLIPLIGWSLGFIQLIFMGPSTWNIISGALYIVGTIVLAVLAKRSACIGEFYEDAESFAKEYAEMREKSRKGDIAFQRIGAKKKYKRADVEYKGYNANAIFYRQMLEYKKETFGIFGMRSLIFGAVGVMILITNLTVDIDLGFGLKRILILPGCIAYMTILFSGYRTKWEQEVENPYAFLIPDTLFRKTWNATKMEHVKAFVDGVLITVPGGIGLGLTLLQMIMIIIAFIGLNATKVYFYMAIESLLGHSLDAFRFVLVIIKIIIMVLVVTASIIAAAIGTVAVGAEFGLLMVFVVNVIIAVAGLFISSLAFEHMELS